MSGSDQIPLAIDLLNAAQQEMPQATGLLDLSVHWVHDRFALGVVPGTILAAELAIHAGFDVGVLGQRAAFLRQWLPVRQTAGGDAALQREAAGLHQVAVGDASLQPSAQR